MVACYQRSYTPLSLEDWGTSAYSLSETKLCRGCDCTWLGFEATFNLAPHMPPIDKVGAQSGDCLCHYHPCPYILLQWCTGVFCVCINLFPSSSQNTVVVAGQPTSHLPPVTVVESSRKPSQGILIFSLVMVAICPLVCNIPSLFILIPGVIFALVVSSGLWLYLQVLGSSCLATKVLISKYLAIRRAVVSGGWGNRLDKRVPISLLQHP